MAKVRCRPPGGGRLFDRAAPAAADQGRRRDRQGQDCRDVWRATVVADGDDGETVDGGDGDGGGDGPGAGARGARLKLGARVLVLVLLMVV